MQLYRHVSLLLMIFVCATCSYGQAWKQYTDSAKFFEEQKRVDVAIEYYSKARKELKRDSAESISYATSCNKLAGLYRIMENYLNAEPLYQEVKQIREKVLGKKHSDYASSCNNLALTYQGMELYAKAELLYIEAKNIWGTVPEKHSAYYVLSCGNLANLYVITGRYEQAELLYLEAKEIHVNILGKKDLYYAKLCNRLANLYDDIRQFEKAEPLFLEAKQIREAILGKCCLEYTYSCISLANFYQHTGLYGKAKSHYLEAKQILEETSGKRSPDYIALCGNLANLYSKTLQKKKAESLYLEAKQILKKLSGSKNLNYAALCNGLAILYRSTKRYKDAEMLLLEAKEIWEKVLGSEANQGYAASCCNLANVYVDMEQYEKAGQLYLEAKKIMQKALGKHHSDYGTSCGNLGNFYRLTNQPLLAEKEFDESFSVKAYNVRSVFQFTNEREKTAYINNISGEDDDAYSFFVSKKIKAGHPYSLSLFHRNPILSSSQALKKQLFYTSDTTLLNKYNKWISLKKEFSVIQAKPMDERKGDVVKIEEADLLEKELTRLSSAFAKQQQQIDWKDIQNSLKADEASVEFTSFHFTDGKRSTDTILYVAFVLRKDSLLPTTVFLFKEKQLQDLLSFARYKTTKAGVERLYTPDGTAIHKKVSKNTIYELVWKPLEKELKGIKTVYFSPSGLLHRIAFAALPVNSSEVLSDRYRLTQLSTTATVADQRSFYVTDTDKVQLYGGISYNVDTTALKDVALTYHHDIAGSRSLPDDITRSGQWNELPGTNKEIEGIVSLSGNHKANITSYSGINATEENIKFLDSKASPAVLHIATHGFFFPDPKQDKKYGKNYKSGTAFKLSNDPLMRSGLLFAGANNAWQNKSVAGIEDGILTAYEVSNLYLPDTKLVVLSACETGLGDIRGNEGVYGLQRAFKIAGVHNLVMSLWKVSDLETAEFMQAFYKNLFAQQTISNAFYDAQNVMKNKYRHQPYKWAAWVLVR